MKRCSKCGLKKELTEFTKDNNTKDKLDCRCKLCNSKRCKKWAENNKEEKAMYNKQHYMEYREKILIQKGQYTKEHKKEKAIYDKLYRKEKLKNDPIYRLTCNIRRRFNLWLNGNKKSKGTFQYINCIKEDLIKHLMSQFYDNPETGEKMCWENYGKWEIDHRMPLSSFDATSEADMYEAWCKENLQPLWAKDNRKKGNKT